MRPAACNFVILFMAKINAKVNPVRNRRRCLCLIPNGVKILLLVVVLASLSPFIYKEAAVYYKCRKINYALDKSVAQEAKQFSGKYSIYVEGLGTCKFSYFYNISDKFPAASLIKVPIMAAVFQKVNEGKLNLNSEFTLGKKDITPGSGILRYRKVPFRITLRKLVELMVTKSDNTAANKIIDILGFEHINNFFLKAGLKDTLLKRRMMDFSSRRKGIENYTSCRDMAYILKKIYKRELINAYYSQKMLSLLKRQKINDRIPRYLPGGAVVAHKTGLEKNVVSDAGIVFSKSYDYIICVIISDFSSYKQAKDFIAKLSLTVYNTQDSYK